MTQNERILAYIDCVGSITQREALNELGVARLASRVNDLRKLGHPIISERVASTDSANRAIGRGTGWG